MELSIHEAQTGFAEAADAAARFERGVVTKAGRPSVGMIPAQRAVGKNFARTALDRRTLESDDLNIELPADFDNAEFSRQVLGLEC